MDKFKLSSLDALAALGKSQKEFITLFEHGSLSVELYQPNKIDQQQPHEQDEIYVIIAGTGKFTLEKQTFSFASGDFFFVPAGKAHRFTDFSADFSTWVFFFGPKGGEVPQKNAN
ncbi:cupin domain-containing protein [Catalinimonas niigatensis]|uniref:cupin domain-containing protein n=1 Tax=Catalinimonas niigatensis TaxID=1397264 RepID=UPI0026669318|nr:cupin domain-containing protein [Catalinimonas niigatensis]WPP51741.1 cupin domain-containing protein [Catalinimonas niigatensis]